MIEPTKSPYIDGFAFPVLRDRIRDYERVAKAVAEIYVQHGALEYREFIGDDLNREGTRPFPDLLNSTGDQVVIFGWIVFESRNSRDQINASVEADPRMPELIAPLLEPSNPIFDPTQMAYGGFQPLVQTLHPDAN